MRNTLVSFCLLTTALWGQSFTGSIRGTVSDSTQAGVPNAKVIAVDTDRNVEYPTQADSSGRYSFPSLPTASYTVTNLQHKRYEMRYVIASILNIRSNNARTILPL